MDSVLLAVTISCSILAFLLLLIPVILLCQAQRSANRNNKDNHHVEENKEAAAAAASSSPGLFTSGKYNIRTYFGCFPRCNGPYKECTKMRVSDVELRPCWLKLCFCCCQDITNNGHYLNAVVPKPSVRSTLTINSNNNGSSSSSPVSAAEAAVIQKKMRPSLLAMEPIILPSSRSYKRSAELQSIPEATGDSVIEFYAHQIEVAAADDRTMY